MKKDTKQSRANLEADRVHALIQANLVSAKAYLSAAELIDDRQEQAKVRAWARERTLQADRLARALVDLGLTKQPLGNWLKRLADAALQMQKAVATGDVQRVYAGALRSEKLLQKMYEQLLADPDYLPLSKELKQQYAQVRAVCFDVRRKCS